MNDEKTCGDNRYGGDYPDRIECEGFFQGACGRKAWICEDQQV